MDEPYAIGAYTRAAAGDRVADGCIYILLFFFVFLMGARAFAVVARKRAGYILWYIFLLLG